MPHALFPIGKYHFLSPPSVSNVIFFLTQYYGDEQNPKKWLNNNWGSTPPKTIGFSLPREEI